MKKIILLLISAIFFMPYATAKEITFHDVANRLKTDNFKGELNFFQNVKDNSIITMGDNYIEIIYTPDENDLILKEKVITKFHYDGKLITYTLNANKNNINELNGTIISDMWITQLIYIVGELNDYTIEEITELLKSEKITEMNLEKNGIEMKCYTYSFELENGTSSGTTTDIFKININNLNIYETTNKHNSETNNEVSNPQTGLEIPYILLFLCIILLSLIYFKNKNNIYKL